MAIDEKKDTNLKRTNSIVSNLVFVDSYSVRIKFHFLIQKNKQKKLCEISIIIQENSKRNDCTVSRNEEEKQTHTHTSEHICYV